MRTLAAAFVAVLALGQVAAAQPVSEAEKLFQEGRELLEAGQPEAACAKFEQSMAKDPRQVGVLMNLAVCNERAGKLATALALYREALDRATEADLPRATTLAQTEIDKLVKRVPVLELEHPHPALPGEKLVIDDAVVPLDTKELPVDPGTHVVTLTAPGRLPYEERIQLRGTDRKTVVLPELELPRNKIVERRSSSQRLVGKLLTFGGATAVVVAGGLAYYAKRDYDSLFDGAMPRCGMYPDVDGKAVCDAEGQRRADRDRKLGTTSAFVGGIGAAVAITGIVLWLTSPSETARTVIVPTASDRDVGVMLRGRF